MRQLLLDELLRMIFPDANDDDYDERRARAEAQEEFDGEVCTT